MRGERVHQRMENILDKNDPFDRLIIELGYKGVLDVCVVGLGADNKNTSK
jgi:hypothetical protein